MAKVLIIIPVYNEQDAVLSTINSLKRVDADLLVVNDGSTDKSQKIVVNSLRVNHRLRLVSLPVNSGIGAAMQTGFLYALRNGYEYAVQFDGDGQHDALSVEGLLRHAVDNNLDLCVGSRYLDLDTDNFRSTPLRRLGIKFFSRLIMLLTGGEVKDATSGFRVYGRRALKMFSAYYPDDYPEPESISWSFRNKLKVGEFPVKMKERQGGESSISHIRSVYYMLKVTVAIFIDRVRKKEY